MVRGAGINPRPAPWNTSNIGLPNCPSAGCSGSLLAISGSFTAQPAYVGSAAGIGDVAMWAVPTTWVFPTSRRPGPAYFRAGPTYLPAVYCAGFRAQLISHTTFRGYPAAWYRGSHCPKWERRLDPVMAHRSRVIRDRRRRPRHPPPPPRRVHRGTPRCAKVTLSNADAAAEDLPARVTGPRIAAGEHVRRHSAGYCRRHPGGASRTRQTPGAARPYLALASAQRPRASAGGHPPAGPVSAS